MADTASLECGFCLETFTGRSYPAGRDTVCPKCASEHIVPLFLNACKYEAHYPPKWGNQLLNHNHYASLLPPYFGIQFQAKKQKYRTPFAQRVYCKHMVYSDEARKPTGAPQSLVGWQVEEARAWGRPVEVCGNFLGPRARGRKYWCPGCHGFMCGECGARQWGNERDRVCEVQQGERAEEQDPYEGLVKGKDYQLCPNQACGMPVYLGDGCNHIVCPGHACRTQYCFVCGEIAAHNSRHWAIGRPCPRYNQPGASNALHDGDRVANGRVVGPAEGLVPFEAPAPAAPPIRRRNAIGEVDNDGALRARVNAWRADVDQRLAPAAAAPDLAIAVPGGRGAQDHGAHNPPGAERHRRRRSLLHHDGDVQPAPPPANLNDAPPQQPPTPRAWNTTVTDVWFAIITPLGMFLWAILGLAVCAWIVAFVCTLLALLVRAVIQDFS